MKNKKPLSEMSIEELRAEKYRLIDRNERYFGIFVIVIFAITILSIGGMYIFFNYFAFE